MKFILALVVLAATASAGGPASDGSSKEELAAFLEEAQSYAKEVGREAALEAFGEPEGEFVRDGQYVFAYDYDGTLLAHPFLPDHVGENDLDLEDPNGVFTVRNMILLAKRGGGYVYDVNPDQAQGDGKEMRLVYVLPVDEETWIGSGVYLGARAPRISSEARENLTAVRGGVKKVRPGEGKRGGLQGL